jgi:hypothetical protein
MKSTFSEAVFRAKLVVGLAAFGWLCGACGYIAWAMHGDVDLPTLIRVLPIAWTLRSFHAAAITTAIALPVLALLIMRKPRADRGLPDAPPTAVRKPW